MRVAALDKPAGQMCQHQTDTGCGNYDHRPAACREWYCMWVRDTGKTFADHHRPDRLGVFFTATKPEPITGVQTILCHEVWPGAAQTPEPIEVIHFLRRFAPVMIIPARTAPATPEDNVRLTISAAH
jgi:Fe-S-cluster containining protein